jgi:hypothetical protein
MAPKAMKVATKRAAKELAESEPEHDAPEMTDEEVVSPKPKGILKRPAAHLDAEGDESSAPKAKKPKTPPFSPMVRRLSLELKKERKGGRKAKEVAVPEACEATPEKIVRTPKVNKTQELINVIHRTINSIPYKAPPVAGVRLHPCVLTSIDEDGYPSMRTVVPSHMEPDLSEIRIVTSIDTKKIQEIQKNKHVSLHYQDQRGRGGWVTLKGDAKINFKPEGDMAQVAVRPERCEVVSYMEGPTSADNGEGWKPAVLVRPNGGADGWRRTQ